MKNKKILYLILLLILVIVIIFIIKSSKKGNSNDVISQIKPVYSDIQTIITTTASVQPQNRLEVKPQVNGRLEQVLVKEGDYVRAGQVVAWMSSTERAALIDSARAQGQASVKYWEDIYKPIPLVSPIYGQVIVQTVQPGQTITTSDDVVVISDRLIVEAQVDETDIGHVKLGMLVNLALDAYPDINVTAKVVRIYYESVVVNNVTIYKVDILPDKIPSVFRSGMSSTVNIITMNKKHIITLPVSAVIQRKGKGFVLLSKNSQEQRQKIETGISDDKNIEIVSGLSTNDIVLEKVQKLSGRQKQQQGTNPFMPSPPGGGKK